MLAKNRPIPLGIAAVFALRSGWYCYTAGMESEEDIIERACEYIKQHKDALTQHFCGDCHPVANPITVCMAGSPGAGKTEVSIELAESFRDRPIRIDADEIRALCPGYTGANAHLFQKAASRGVDTLYDFALKQRINCIIDGTFAHPRALQNIQRSLKRTRSVFVMFVYQDPAQAWYFTKAREIVQARRILLEDFVRGYFDSHANVLAAKQEFGDRIVVHVLIKNARAGERDLITNVDASYLDRHLPGRYSEEELIERLKDL